MQEKTHPAIAGNCKKDGDECIMKIVTFNLRCVWEGDGINGFVHRAGMIYDKISSELPEVIAFQEVIPKSLKFLQKAFPEYLFLGQYRGADYSGEGLYTAIKKDSLDIIAFEAFWISPTPYIAGSRFPNQSVCPRICIMTQIRDKKTNRMLRIFNLHLDHISDEARIQGMECIFEQIKIFNNKKELPTVVLGDFNANPESAVIKMCSENTDIVLTDVTSNIDCTFHNFGQKKSKIDYIFISKEIPKQICSAAKWEDMKDGIYLSDHYPVCMNLDMEKIIV